MTLAQRQNKQTWNTTAFSGCSLFDDEKTGELSYTDEFVIFMYRSNLDQPAVTNKLEQEVTTIADMLKEVGDTLGLNNSQLAKIAAVGRATLYTHINGEREPSKDTQRVYRKLYDLSQEVNDIKELDPRKLRTVMVTGDTVLGHLMVPNWDVATIAGYIRSVAGDKTNNDRVQVADNERLRRTRHLTKSG